MEEEKLIYEWDKNPYKKFRLTEREYGGTTYYHFREWEEVSEGKLVPTKTGIALTKDDLFEFFNAVEALGKVWTQPKPKSN